MFLGIDPGVTGAFALLNADGTLAFVQKYPGGPHETAEIIQDHKITLAVLEHVHASPIMGKQSAFTFGANFGTWQGILSTLHIPYLLITPQKWQKKVFDSVQKGKSKELALSYAQRRFPELKLRATQHNEADAVCLAVYGWVYWGEGNMFKSNELDIMPEVKSNVTMVA